MRYGAVLIFLFLCLGCKHEARVLPSVSFYYWRTTFALGEAERKALHDCGVTRLYVRYCDVALKQGKAVPVAPVVFQDEVPDAVGIVPVVYIRNEVMLDRELDPAALAKQIIAYIEQINTSRGITSSEIQIDCDWTLASRDAYFSFLNALRQPGDYTVSVTIRLHQVKYFARTGVPPADRRVLMYYNMGHIDGEVTSSVYDRATALDYLDHAGAYPHVLEVALPVFTWGIHLRDNRVIGLLNKTDESAFLGDRHFDRKTEPFFEVTENVLKMGRYFKRGDRVKIETVRADDLREMADDLADKLPYAPREIIFYDLDAFNLNHYDEAILETVRGAF